jgi:hypothetical protein
MAHLFFCPISDRGLTYGFVLAQFGHLVHIVVFDSSMLLTSLLISVACLSVVLKRATASSTEFHIIIIILRSVEDSALRCDLTSCSSIPTV